MIHFALFNLLLIENLVNSIPCQTRKDLGGEELSTRRVRQKNKVVKSDNVR